LDFLIIFSKGVLKHFREKDLKNPRKIMFVANSLQILQNSVLAQPLERLAIANAHVLQVLQSSESKKRACANFD
jgi:hypothetical protein